MTVFNFRHTGYIEPTSFMKEFEIELLSYNFPNVVVHGELICVSLASHLVIFSYRGLLAFIWPSLFDSSTELTLFIVFLLDLAWIVSDCRQLWQAKSTQWPSAWREQNPVSGELYYRHIHEQHETWLVHRSNLHCHITDCDVHCSINEAMYAM